MLNVLYDPFFNATRDVFKLMLDISNISDKPLSAYEEATPGQQMEIAIGIIGDLEGKVIYRFPKETSLEMVKIMSGMEFFEIDDFVTSALGEIANIISGNVLSALSVQELTCDILPPQIITQREDNDGEFEFNTCMEICTDIGSILLNIMLNTAVVKA